MQDQSRHRTLGQTCPTSVDDYPRRMCISWNPYVMLSHQLPKSASVFLSYTCGLTDIALAVYEKFFNVRLFKFVDRSCFSTLKRLWAHRRQRAMQTEVCAVNEFGLGENHCAFYDV